MLSTFITSKNRRRLLAVFLTHPDERFYLKQLKRDLVISSSRLLQDELAKLQEVGFITSVREGNARFYQVNKGFPLYPELKSMIFKTVGLADFLHGSLDELGEIQAAFIYGSVAKNLEEARSDIDVMIIGDVDMDRLHEAISQAEASLGRELNYSVYGLADWKKQLKAGKAFVRDVAEGPKIFLIGGEDDIR
jgi:predicted nucleotidyltransferase